MGQDLDSHFKDVFGEDSTEFAEAQDDFAPGPAWPIFTSMDMGKPQDEFAPGPALPVFTSIDMGMGEGHDGWHTDMSDGMLGNDIRPDDPQDSEYTLSVPTQEQPGHHAQGYNHQHGLFPLPDPFNNLAALLEGYTKEMDVEGDVDREADAEIETDTSTDQSMRKGPNIRHRLQKDSQIDPNLAIYTGVFQGPMDALHYAIDRKRDCIHLAAANNIDATFPTSDAAARENIGRAYNAFFSMHNIVDRPRKSGSASHAALAIQKGRYKRETVEAKLWTVHAAAVDAQLGMRVIEDYSSFKSEEYPSFADRWEKLVELLGCSKAACKALMDPEISARMAVAPLFELSLKLQNKTTNASRDTRFGLGTAADAAGLTTEQIKLMAANPHAAANMDQTAHTAEHVAQDTTAPFTPPPTQNHRAEHGPENPSSRRRKAADMSSDPSPTLKPARKNRSVR